MARQMKNAKRANRHNPRVDRDNVIHFDPLNDVGYNNDHQRGRNKSQKNTRKKVTLLPRNIAQEFYLEKLEDETQHIIFAVGPAGTGKTLLATQFAIQQLQSGNIKKILITRPTVSVDESYGYLKGSLIDKLQPWVIPIIDVFKEHYDKATVEKMLEDEVIEIAPLGFARGRTFKHCVVIFDEVQNSTPDQMKMMLTRIGEGCRMFCTGDLRQHDRGYDNNGLKDFLHRLEMNKTDNISVCKFGRQDIERHPVVSTVLKLYGEE